MFNKYCKQSLSVTIVCMNCAKDVTSCERQLAKN